MIWLCAVACRTELHKMGDPAKEAQFAKRYSRDSCAKRKLRRYIASFTTTADAIPIRLKTDCLCLCLCLPLSRRRRSSHRLLPIEAARRTTTTGPCAPNLQHEWKRNYKIANYPWDSAAGQQFRAWYNTAVGTITLSPYLLPFQLTSRLLRSSLTSPRSTQLDRRDRERSRCCDRTRSVAVAQGLLYACRLNTTRTP
jgi:hypothetical protein